MLAHPKDNRSPDGEDEEGKVIAFPFPGRVFSEEDSGGGNEEGAPRDEAKEPSPRTPDRQERPPVWGRLRTAATSAAMEHTVYALDSVRSYWEAAIAHASDPGVRTAVERDIQRRLDSQRMAAEKALKRARTDRARAAAQADLDSLVWPETEVDLKVGAARTRRLLVRSVLPAGMVFGPLAGAVELDMWWSLVAYPAVWAWAGVHGRTLASPEAPPALAGPGAAGGAVGGADAAVELPDMCWVPGRRGIGVDTTTGETVPVPEGRLLVAGTSGAGKSVTVRVLIADALARGERVVYIDAKGEDAELWRGKGVRVAITPAEIHRVAGELIEENAERGEANRGAGRDKWVPDAARPNLMVLVDEGAEVIGIDSKATPVLDALTTIGRTGRARGIRLVWCTQNPTVGDGIDRQVKSILTGARVAMRTATETESRTVLGNDATQNGWKPHELPEYGQCLIRDGRRAPAPVAVWDLSDSAVVRSLPDRPHWERPCAPEGHGEDAAPVSGGSGWSRVELAVLDALNTLGGSGSSARVVEHLAGRHGRTPVIEALNSLQDQGLVSKGEGHRSPWTRRR